MSDCAWTIVRLFPARLWRWVGDAGQPRRGPSLHHLHVYIEEVALARIYAGFHHCFSTEVGRQMGRAIGTHSAGTVMQPLRRASTRVPIVPESASFDPI